MKELHLNDKSNDIDKLLEEIREKNQEEKYNAQAFDNLPVVKEQKHKAEPTSGGYILRYLTVALMFIALSGAVFWLFVDTFKFQALHVALVWVSLAFSMRFYIEKVWVFHK